MARTESAAPPSTHSLVLLDRLDNLVGALMVFAAVVGMALAFWLVRAVDARHMPPPAPLDGVSASARMGTPWLPTVRSREMAQGDVLAAQVMILQPPSRALPEDFVALAYRNTGTDARDFPSVNPARAEGDAARVGARLVAPANDVAPIRDAAPATATSALPVGGEARRGNTASPAMTMLVVTPSGIPPGAQRAHASWQ